MPYRWVVDSTARIVMVRGWGPMDLEESLKAPRDLLVDPRFDPEYGVLVDLRDLEYEPGADDLIAVTQNLIDMKPLLRGRVGLVVQRELSTAAEVGAAMAAAGGFTMRVFSEPDSARDWLSSRDVAD